MKKKIIEKEYVFGFIVISSLICLYFLVFVRGFISNKYMFVGDTNDLSYLEYLALHSLKYFNTLPWWDPTFNNGQPLYYIFQAWFNYLGPIHLPSLVIFKIANLFTDISINTYMVFRVTIYVFSLNLIAVYLISRELVTNRRAAILPALIFSFSYFQIFNIHDSHVVEAMIAPLFYVYALIRFNNKRTINNLVLLTLFLIIYLASLGKAIQTSAIFWSSIFTVLILIFNLDIIKDTYNLLLKLIKTSKGKIFLTLSIMLMMLGFWASFSSVYYNADNFLRYRAGKVSLELSNKYSSSLLPVESSEIWTVINTWLPFSAIHDLILNFAWQGHDYRYIGLVTLPLIMAVFVLGLKNRYTYIFFLTYFVCNAYIIYTTDNIVYRILTDSSSAFNNSRNMLTGFPRGGPILFLVFLSGMGLDLLLMKDSRNYYSTYNENAVSNKLFVVAMSLLIFVGLFLFFSFVVFSILFKMVFILYRLLDKLPQAWDIVQLLSNHIYRYEERSFQMIQNLGQVRHTLFHMSLYLILFSCFCFILFSLKNKTINKWILISLFVLTFTDLTISISYQIDKGDIVLGYNGRMPYDPNRVIPDNIKLTPITSEKEQLIPTNFFSPWTNYGELGYGYKEWLILATSEDGRKFLTNWNPTTNKMKRYPEFKFYSNAFYIPFEKIKEINFDKSIFEKTPLFYLHDERLAYSNKGMPNQIDGDVEVIEYTFNKVVVKTNFKTDGFLCFYDNYDRFWSAYIDNKKTKIYRANFCFKAIKLNSGEHIVTWIYNPYPIKIAYTSFYILLGIFIGCCGFFRKTSLVVDNSVQEDKSR